MKDKSIIRNKAVIIDSPLNLMVVERPIRHPKKDEVLIRTRYVALCGSDIKLYQGIYSAPHKYPIVIGHEWVGEIVEVGPGTSGNWRIGDIATGDCSIFCDSCDYCARKEKNHCISVEKNGITVHGSCARFITVNQRYLYHCPRLPDIKALALVEPLAVSAEAVLNHLSARDLKKVRSALVIGSGGIGALTVFFIAGSRYTGNNHCRFIRK